MTFGFRGAFYTIWRIWPNVRSALHRFHFEGTRAAFITLCERLSVIASDARISPSPMARVNVMGRWCHDQERINTHPERTSLAFAKALCVKLCVLLIVVCPNRVQSQAFNGYYDEPNIQEVCSSLPLFSHGWGYTWLVSYVLGSGTCSVSLRGGWLWAFWEAATSHTQLPPFTFRRKLSG